MSKKFSITAPIFHDEDKAREHLESLLWPDGPECPRADSETGEVCGATGDRITKLQGKSTRPGVYKCKDCRKPFTVTVGTVMERSHIPLTKWLQATFFMSTAKKSMSAKNLERLLGVSYECAWFLFHRLRECTPTPSDAGPLGGEGKIVEADTTWIGGKETNKHKNKRDRKHLYGGKGKKFAVHTLVERGGGVRSHHVANVNGKTLRPILFQHVSRKSALMTDTAGEYYHLGKAFARHETVNHQQDEYVRGDAYTNSAESFFALLKRGVYGQFHSVSEAHLPRYLREFDWRQSNRHLSEANRMDALIVQAKGKRLMYRWPDKTSNTETAG